jgi:HlyD family secretion protein
MDGKRKRILLGLIVAVAAGIAIKLIFFPSTFYYAGTLEATNVDVPERVNSTIEIRDVDEGQRVAQGQRLIKLACEDYRLAAAIAGENYQRAAKLFKEGSQSKENLDQLKNRMDDADLRVSWCDVTAPLPGTVLDKYHEPGEWVTQGMRLFTLANLKDIYAYVYVPQPLVAKLSLGQKLTGYLPELGMKGFPGSITHINDEAEFTPKNVQTREERTRLVFGIKIAFQNDQEILKPGMSIEVPIPEN